MWPQQGHAERLRRLHDVRSDISSERFRGCSAGCQPLHGHHQLVRDGCCDEAEPDVIVRMVEDSAAIVLPVFGAQAPTDGHDGVFALRRPRQDDAAPRPSLCRWLTTVMVPETTTMPKETAKMRVQ